jgi:hypothetical protein
MWNLAVFTISGTIFTSIVVDLNPIYAYFESPNERERTWSPKDLSLVLL